MGGRSSKTKPARSPAKSQNQDTVVESFDMSAVNDTDPNEIGNADVKDTSKNAPGEKGTAARQGKQEAQTQNSQAPSRGAAGSSVVHDIWESKADNNLAPLSALYGKNTKPLELQVSSSEDEDDDDEHVGGSHRKRRKSARKKRKSHSSKPATEKSKLSALKPVKPPPAAHTPTLPHPVPVELQVPHSHEDDNVVKAIGDEKNSSSPRKSPTGKADSPSRFFAFKRRMSSSRPNTGTKEKEKSVREKDKSTRERSSGSPEKAVSTSPNPKTGTTSLGRFMEWKEGTYRSSGRESSSRLSEIPGEKTTAVVDGKDEVEDVDALERETASALASAPARAPWRSFQQNQSEQLKENEKRAAAASSPTASVKSQRSGRSAGRNLNIDDVDEHIMSDILAEALDT